MMMVHVFIQKKIFDCDGNCIADLDCNGECGGDAVVDECGICEGGWFVVYCWTKSFYR